MPMGVYMYGPAPLTFCLLSEFHGEVTLLEYT